MAEEEEGVKMAPDSKLIIVANLLPSKFDKDSISEGVTETVISNPTSYPVHYRHYHYLFPNFDGIDTLAVGSLTRNCLKDTSDENLQRVQDMLVDRHRCMPVFLEDLSYHLFYDVFCKQFLYPKLHSLPGPSVMDKASWQAYRDVNVAFSRVVVSAYKPGDVIWINDYHLMLLPDLLREAIPDATIGFFLHTPFPSSEIFRSIPVRETLLMAMLGANLIGFQNYEYLRHFMSASMRLLGIDAEPHRAIRPARGALSDVPVTLSVMPIGIDRERVESYLDSAVTRAAREQYDREFEGVKVVVGYDRIDPVKGLLQKLKIFGELLEHEPQLVGKVVLVQVAVPTDDSVYGPKLTQEVGRINGRFGSVAYTPVHFHAGTITWEEQLALFSRADVLLVTSIRDGMNLTPAEYVLCQGSSGTGCAVVSEFAGTAESLCGATLINPWDYAGSARALARAVHSSGSQDAAARMLEMHSYVSSHSATAWGSRFIHEVARAGEHFRATLQHLPPLRLPRLAGDYDKARERVLLLDYDGTLTPIQKLPELATPPPAILSALRTLANDGTPGRTHVYIVSGRDKESLDGFLGDLPNVGLSAEHGGHLRRASEPEWTSFLDGIDTSWMPLVREIFDFYTERTPGSHVEVKAATLCWHYRNAEQVHAQWQANELRNHIEETVVGHFPVNVLIGKKTVEVRPSMIDKGTVVRRILDYHPNADFVLCVGDDRTDEDMFHVVKDRRAAAPEGAALHTIIVGLKKAPSASFFVEDTSAFANVLHELARLTAAETKKEGAPATPAEK